MSDQMKRRVTHELRDYIASLSMMQSSINAVLEYEYNTPEKAQELMHYYESRPNLAEYTRTKELSRMEYRVVLPTGAVEEDKSVIARNYLLDDSIIARCSNQSLLADLLQVLTGPDLIVRPQYMAVCVAHRCQFTIHLDMSMNEGNSQGRVDDMVQCTCHLHLSLPTADGSRLDVAAIRSTVVFATGNVPTVEFRVNSIDVTLPPGEEGLKLLSSSAEFLSEMMGMEGLSEDQFAQTMVPSAGSGAPPDAFRDAFLENSQKFFSQSSAGMRSALQQMESVVNIKKKINLVKGGYNSLAQFIPDSDQLLAAEQEALELASVAEARKRHQSTASGYIPTGTNPRSNSNQNLKQPTTTSERDRPKSILGGFVLSGLNRLAKTVALPDDDPEIYGIAASPEKPQLYRDPRAPTQQSNAPTFPRPPRAQNAPSQSLNAMANHAALDQPSYGGAPSQGQKYQFNSNRSFVSQGVENVGSERQSNDFQSEEGPGRVQEIGEELDSEVADGWDDEDDVDIDIDGDVDDALGPDTKVPSSEEAQNIADVHVPPSEEAQKIVDSLEPPSDFTDGWDDDDDDIDLPDDSLEISTVNEHPSGLASMEENRPDSFDKKEHAFGSSLLKDEYPVQSSQNENDVDSLSHTKEENAFGLARVAPPNEEILRTKGTMNEVRDPLKMEGGPIVDVDYDPSDDIIATRKRWINPVPNRPPIFY